MSKSPRNASRSAKASRNAPRVIVKARLGRKPPPPNETARDRFKRIGERRVNEIVQKIALLGNLSGNNYECNGEDIERMKSSIQIALDGALSRFAPKIRQRTQGFTFDPNSRSPSLVPN